MSAVSFSYPVIVKTELIKISRFLIEKTCGSRLGNEGCTENVLSDVFKAVKSVSPLLCLPSITENNVIYIFNLFPVH